jgi:hypothetical protein
MLKFILALLLLSNSLSANELIGEWAVEHKKLLNSEPQPLKIIYEEEFTYHRVFIWGSWSKPLNRNQYEINGNILKVAPKFEPVVYSLTSANTLTLTYPNNEKITLIKSTIQNAK